VFLTGTQTAVKPQGGTDRVLSPGNGTNCQSSSASAPCRSIRYGAVEVPWGRHHRCGRTSLDTRCAPLDQSLSARLYVALAYREQGLGERMPSR